MSYRSSVMCNSAAIRSARLNPTINTVTTGTTRHTPARTHRGRGAKVDNCRLHQERGATCRYSDFLLFSRQPFSVSRWVSGNMVAESSWIPAAQ